MRVAPLAPAQRLLIVVALIAAVACIGFIYTTNSVVNMVHEVLVEIRGVSAACRSARKQSTDPDVLKELPELPSWYSQHCKD